MTIEKFSIDHKVDNIKILDTLFYALHDGRELIEIDHESAWQRDVDWNEFKQPRALMWSQLIPLPGRNVIIVCDRKKNITQIFHSAPWLLDWYFKKQNSRLVLKKQQ